MKKETKTLLVLVAVLVVAGVASLAFLLRPAGHSLLTADIQVGNTLVRTIALDLAENETFSIEEETGLPITFQIEDHAIRFLDSNCPDKICVHSGFLSRDMDIASCLPNQTVLVLHATE